MCASARTILFKFILKKNEPAVFRASNCVSDTFLVSSGNDEISNNPVVPLTFTSLLFLLSNATFIATGTFGRPAISIATEIASQIAFRDSAKYIHRIRFVEISSQRAKSRDDEDKDCHLCSPPRF